MNDKSSITRLKLCSRNYCFILQNITSHKLMRKTEIYNILKKWCCFRQLLLSCIITTCRCWVIEFLFEPCQSINRIKAGLSLSYIFAWRCMKELNEDYSQASFNSMKAISEENSKSLAWTSSAMLRTWGLFFLIMFSIFCFSS